MGRGIKIDWETHWPKIKEMLDDGYNCPAIEKVVGIRAMTINAYCSRIGHKVKRHNRDKAKFTWHEIDLMVALRFHGLRNGEIAEKFDCTYHDVSRLTAKKFRMAKMRLNGVTIEEIAWEYGLTPNEVLKATSNIMQQLEENGWKTEHASTNTITNVSSAAGGIN